MSQQVYPISYTAPKSTLIPAFNHWQKFLPKNDSNAEIGTVIHVPGNPFRGFHVEIAEKDLATEKKPLTKYLLCATSLEAVEKLQKEAAELGGLKVSKNPLSGEPNCQDWIVKFVVRCVECQLLEEEALTRLKESKASKV